MDTCYYKFKFYGNFSITFVIPVGLLNLSYGISCCSIFGRTNDNQNFRVNFFVLLLLLQNYGKFVPQNFAHCYFQCDKLRNYCHEIHLHHKVNNFTKI